MDKESPEITPKNLDGSDIVVETVKRASDEDIKKAAEEEKAKKQDYYVDPLEQEALMKEKLDKIEAEKAEKKAEEEDEKTETVVDTTLRPDMNVSGYFSTGVTANKTGIMQRPASTGALTLSAIIGIIGAIYSAFYTVTLISTSFNANWFMGWIFAVIVIVSIFVLFNCARSLKAQKDSIKRKALLGIVGSCITAIPLIAWIIHLITSVV